MAVSCSSPLIIPGDPIKKPVRRVLMLHNSHFPAKRLPMLHITSSTTNNKVFEDKSRGIICYKDDSGDIVCEGYDEGPRPEPTYHDRELHIIDLLQQSLFQISEDNRFSHAEMGIGLQKDFDWNDFIDSLHRDLN